MALPQNARTIIMGVATPVLSLPNGDVGSLFSITLPAVFSIQGKSWASLVKSEFAVIY